MSTLVVANLKSSTTSPPQILNSANTEIGEFCRAWVNFVGTGTVTIRGSFNVTSITDNGTGDYTVNFTNALPDANFAANTSSGPSGAITQPQNYAAGSYRFTCINTSSTAVDPANVNVSIFR